MAGKKPRIPAEYQQVEWIGTPTRNANANGHYIDTGIVPTVNTGIVARISVDLSTPTNVFGIRQAQSGADNAFLFQEYSADEKFGFARFGSSVKTIPFNEDFHDFVLTTQEVSVDGIPFSLADPVAGQSITLAFRIFGVYAYVSNAYKWYDGAKQKVAVFKILDGTSLVRDFIPCYRKSDSKIGMWDAVTKTFYPAVGTFEKGADIA